MRVNTPVTSVEREFRDGETVVSKTDLNGTIVYVNDYFCEISGYSRVELLGQPHNMLRHPDMPTEAFADFWATLKSGRPWTGMVKNRCKNGDHYWVKVNVTPAFEHGHINGYMAVRTKPDRSEVAAAEQAYRSFKDGTAKSLCIRDGAVLSKRAASRRFAVARWSVAKSLGFTLALLIGLIIGTALVGVLNVRDLGGTMSAAYSERALGLQDLATVRASYALGVLHEADKARSGIVTLSEAARNVGAARERIRSSWANYLAHDPVGAKKTEAAAAIVVLDRADVAAGEIEDALRRGDTRALDNLMKSQAGSAIEPVGPAIGQLLATNVVDLGERLQRGSAVASRTMWYTALLAACAVIAACLLGWWLVRRLRRSIDAAVGCFRLMAEGRLDIEIDTSGRDEIAKILDAAKSMKIKLGIDLDESRRAAERATRVKIALDNASTGVIIADRQGNINYLNQSVLQTLKAAEADIRKDLPHFNAERLLESNIDSFHKNPAHQSQMLQNLTATHRTQIVIGGRTFRLTVNPVFNQQRERLGSALEWIDITAEVQVENEVSRVVSAAAAGDLTQRLEVEGKSGFMKQLATGINELTGKAAQIIDDTLAVAECLARGDLTRTIDREYAGTFLKMKVEMNQTVRGLADVISRVREAADTITSAAVEISSTSQSLSQASSEQAASVEETSASVEQMNASISQNSENAKVTDQMATKSAADAAEGGGAVRKTVDAMKQIAQKISIIDDIAYQTNLLALNAAIEAARAGEHGKGFAVVAAEVGKLAERSQAAAQEIGEVAVASVNLAEQAGLLLDQIVPAIRKTSDLVQEITAAGHEQSTGVGQINLAMGQLSQLTQQNASASEQLAATAQNMSSQAEVLQSAMAFFQVAALESPQGVRGSGVHTHAAPVARLPGRNPASGGHSLAPAAVNKLLDDGASRVRTGTDSEFLRF